MSELIASLKILISSWVGIYLLLPGCLCEILAPLGIDLHPKAGRGVPLVMEDARAEGSQPFPGRCEDDTANRADLIHDEDDEHREVPPVTRARDTIAPAWVFQQLVGFNTGRSPPLNTVSCFSAGRRQAALGVFLL